MDFRNLGPESHVVVVVFVAYNACVISVWELLKFAWPHIHLYWR